MEGTVVALAPVIHPFGGSRAVRAGQLKDPTGEVDLLLWGEETQLVEPGDRVRIHRGYSKRIRGRLSLTLGVAGSLSKMERSTGRRRAM